MENKIKVGWKVHTPNLLEEILANPGTGALVMPLKIFSGLLRQVAKRANELHDPELDRLMLRLTLYSMADPFMPDYNPELLNKLLEGEQNT